MCESGKREERSDELIERCEERKTSTAGRGTREGRRRDGEQRRGEKREKRK